MTEPAMPDTVPNANDLFEIIRITRSMRRLRPDSVPNELIEKSSRLRVGEDQAALIEQTKFRGKGGKVRNRRTAADSRQSLLRRKWRMEGVWLDK
jgi:hypothetical protein